MAAGELRVVVDELRVTVELRIFDGAPVGVYVLLEGGAQLVPSGIHGRRSLLGLLGSGPLSMIFSISRGPSRGTTCRKGRELESRWWGPAESRRFRPKEQGSSCYSSRPGSPQPGSSRKPRDQTTAGLLVGVAGGPLSLEPVHDRQRPDIPECFAGRQTEDIRTVKETLESLHTKAFSAH